MPLKTKYDIYIDSNVAANSTDTQLSEIIPAGKIVRLVSFGGFDPNIGDNKAAIIAIQYGAGTDWKTLRAGGWGTFDFPLNLDIPGDGTKRFRLARKNNSASAKPLVCWLFAVII